MIDLSDEERWELIKDLVGTDVCMMNVKLEYIDECMNISGVFKNTGQIDGCHFKGTMFQLSAPSQDTIV